jgi:hypothetical protein
VGTEEKEKRHTNDSMSSVCFNIGIWDRAELDRSEASLVVP